MYKVGFGDAFLLFLPTADGEKKVLSDCGSIARPPEELPLTRVVEAIVDAVTDERGGVRRPRIDVVVATHRHRDHISGFDRPISDTVEVKEVWMPWKEHPTAPEARSLRESHARLAAGLHAELTALKEPDYEAAAAGLPLREIALNALANEAAMNTLLRGFQPPTPRHQFLPETPTHRTIDSKALPEIVVHVLGPSRDPAVIRRLDPPVGESYLRLAADRVEGKAAPHPFDPEDSCTPAYRTRFAHLSLWDDVRGRTEKLVNDP